MPTRTQPDNAFAARIFAPLQHELDALLKPLAQAERRDVLELLDLIARQLSARAENIVQFRSRLDAIVSTLIGLSDAVDGDCDLEDGDDAESHTAVETAGGGFSRTPTAGHDDDEDGHDAEGLTDDNGVGDADGKAEQYRDRNAR